ncbi:MAG: AAA family ATPase [bacterium]|nr:AAA family ATPase [bacterium]
MTLISEYPQFQLILDHPYAELYRAEKEHGLIKRVILQTLTNEAREIIEAIDPKSSLPQLIPPHQIRLKKGEFLLVYENCDLLFLPQYVTGPMESGAFLDLAVNLVAAVEGLHKNGLIHKDLTPFNILIDPVGSKTYLTGFYCAQGRNLLESDISPFHNLEEAFVYQAPEQSGRINREVGASVDLYALGAIFFELLSGHPPFATKDQMELIHSHIAIVPPPLSVERPDVPPVLDRILQKLLAKTAQERYRTASSLLSDLLHCQRDWQEKQRVDDFELDFRATEHNFRLPTRMYGVEEHRRTLTEAFDQVALGGVEMLMVKGAAGLGKSSLVKLIKGPLKERGGYLIEGRFERQHKDTPYFSLREAFEDLVAHLLTQEEKQLEVWRKRLKYELGENLPILADLLPDLRLILGSDLPNLPVDPLEIQNRIGHAIQKFLGCFTQEGKPLVIFLDNFHFADSASLLALQQFLTDVNSRHLMLLVAFRDSLALQSVSLNMFLEEVEKSGVPIKELRVRPLREKDLNAMLAEAYGSEQDFSELAHLILDKTNGNPFFVKQLLEHLNENSLISWDEAVGTWVWQIEDIHKTAQSKDVVDLLIQKINSLSPESAETIKTAACIGTQFDLNTLALSLDLTPQVLMERLEEPLKKGLIYREVRANDEEISFHFLHNRIHMAALSLWEPKEKRERHLIIGRHLVAHRPEHPTEDWVFKTVNQLNLAVELISEPFERHELARLNLMAGDYSRAIAAYETAWTYYSQGTELLREDSWRSDYELSKELFVRRAEAEYFTGNTEAFKPIFQLLYDNLRSDEEREEVINIKLNLFIKTGDLKQALEIGVDAINHFSDEKVPPNDSEVTIVAQVKMQEMAARLAKHKIETLQFLDPMKNGRKQALMKLVGNVIPAAVIARRNLWVYLTLKMVETSLNEGNCPSSAYGYMNYAVLLCAGMEDYQQGYTMGKMALDLNRQVENRALSSQLNFVFGAFVNHWRAPIREGLEYLQNAAQLGVRYGDFVGAANAIAYLLFTHLANGTPLDLVELEIKKHEDFAKQVKNEDLNRVIRTTRMFLTLSEVDEAATPLQRIGDPSALEAALKAGRNQQPNQWYFLLMAQLHYHLAQYDEAFALIQKSDRLTRNYAQLGVPEHYFYFSLIVMSKYPSMSFEERKRFWDILKSNREKLKKLAQACEANFEDRYFLVCAEMSAASGNFIETIDLYDRAIDAAKAQGRIHLQGMANELAARYYLSRDKVTIARAYLREAFLAYRKWGAAAKLAAMEEEYGPYLETGTVEANSDAQPQVGGGQLLDLAALRRTLETVSLEIDPSSLIRKLLKVILETAGAQRGYFLLEQEGHHRIRAEGSVDDSPPIRICSQAFEDCQRIAQTVISYVIRTRKKVWLDDARNEAIFGYDPYVEQAKPKSILALPVIHHGRMLGILYLENNLTTHAFSRDRVDFLVLLVSQVAISLENSSLYASLARTTEELRHSKAGLERRINDLESKLAEAP